MILLLFILLCLFSTSRGDSVILENECVKTSEECRIRLETFNGLPGRDCFVFSSEYRSCFVINEESSMELEDLNTATILRTEEGSDVSFQNEKKTNGAAVRGSTVWNSPPRFRRYKGKSVIVTCQCNPLDR
ncbi:unnamed protein product [Auanema sp. JU1783]|nr:unnamed protein product [Auanema sp. JU1783]